MTVNISSINDFFRCRRRWVYTWVINRVPKAKAQPLITGGIFHRAMEAHLTSNIRLSDAVMEEVTKTRGEAMNLVPRGGDPRVVPEAKVLLSSAQEMEDLIEVLDMWTDKFPVTKTLEVEQPFSFDIGGEVTLIGRPDRVVMVWGQLFHVQNRTLAAGKPIGLYLELAKRNLHEIGYAYAIQRKYPIYPYGGTIYNIIRKLKYRAKPTKKEIADAILAGRITEENVNKLSEADMRQFGKVMHEPGEIMIQGHVPITAHNYMEGLNDIRAIAAEMYSVRYAYQTYGRLPPSNRAYDGGAYGNSKDPYWPVLVGQTTLEDNELYEDRVDTYSAEERNE